MDTPAIGAIVLNWNLAADTVACVRSLEASALRPATIVVVDNGSSDDSLAVFARELPGARVLALPENVGFARGMNAGIDDILQTGASHVLLLNNDVVADGAMLGTLMEIAMQGSHAILSPLVYVAGEPDRVWHRGVRFGTLSGLPRQVPEQRGTGVMDVDAVPAAVWLAPAAIFRQFGRFDKQNFMYYEDWQFCRRIREAGLRIGVVQRARALHTVSASTRALPALKHYNFARARVRYYLERGPGWKRGLLLSAIVASEAAVLFRLLRAHDRAGLTARVRGLRDGLASLAGQGVAAP